MISQFTNLIEAFNPYDYLRNGRRKPKIKYMFYANGGFIRSNNIILLIYAYSKKQAIYLLKDRYPQYSLDKIEAIDYVEYLKKRQNIITPKNIQQTQTVPYKVDNSGHSKIAFS